MDLDVGSMERVYPIVVKVWVLSRGVIRQSEGGVVGVRSLGLVVVGCKDEVNTTLYTHLPDPPDLLRFGVSQVR